MRQAVFEYIEVDYNRTRRHSSLDHLSPQKYELVKLLKPVSIFTAAAADQEVAYGAPYLGDVTESERDKSSTSIGTNISVLSVNLVFRTLAAVVCPRYNKV